MDDLANVLDGMHLSDGSDDSGASEGAQGDGGPAGPPFSCELCGLHGLTSASQLAEHLAGRRHARAAAGGRGASLGPLERGCPAAPTRYNAARGRWTCNARYNVKRQSATSQCARN